MFDRFWDKEVLGVYAPGSLRDKQRDFFVQGLNYYLGKPKADRIRVFGSPDTCTNTSSHREVCEWKQLSSAQEHLVAYSYESGGLATSWSYRGSFGEFTNLTYGAPQSASPVKNQSERVPSPEERWIHPVKTDRQFEQDNLQCRTEVQGFPRAMWETETDKCLQRNGWTRPKKQ